MIELVRQDVILSGVIRFTTTRGPTAMKRYLFRRRRIAVLDFRVTSYAGRPRREERIVRRKRLSLLGAAALVVLVAGVIFSWT